MFVPFLCTASYGNKVHCSVALRLQSFFHGGCWRKQQVLCVKIKQKSCMGYSLLLRGKKKGMEKVIQL